MAGTMSLSDLSEAMRDIDFAVLTTKTENGEIAGRPMSNNRDVEYRGDSFFFSHGNARTVSDIERDPKVSLAFQDKKGLLATRPFFIAVEGHAELIRDKAAFREHWTADLDRWFERGVDTPDLVLIKVAAKRITYWNGTEEGEVTP